MKALLLAAGYGTRLRPLTNTIPKCLVPINGKPLLEIWLETLNKAGITEFLINTHYLHKEVEKYIENSEYKDLVTLVYEKELLGTGSTILKNKYFFDKNEPFMVIHADNLSIADYKDFISAHYLRPKNTIMSMFLFETDNPESCGIVKENKEQIVYEFYEKVNNPPSTLANGAVYIFDFEIFSILKNINQLNIDLSIHVIPLLMNKIYAYNDYTYHLDIGTIKAYSKAQKWYKKYKNNQYLFSLSKSFNNRRNLEIKRIALQTKINNHKNIQYVRKRVLAIYDTSDLPISQDITTFILRAEVERRKYNLDKIDIIFMIQAEDPSPERHPYVTKDNKTQFIYNLALEQTRLFTMIGSILVFDNRLEFEKFYKSNKNDYIIYPKSYNIKLPFDTILPNKSSHNWIELNKYLEKDSSLLCLTPPKDQIELARKWIKRYVFPRIPITITLREWDSWSKIRNSNIDEWQKLVSYYEKSNTNYIFIIIRDYNKLYDKDPITGKNVIYCNEASSLNSFRAALYQEVTLNLCIANGTSIYLIANSNTKYIQFKVTSDGRASKRADVRELLGLYYGDSFHGSSKYQELIWAQDKFLILKKKTDQMLLLIKKDFGLEPSFYKIKEHTYNLSKTSFDSSIYINIDKNNSYSIKYYLFILKLFLIKDIITNIGNIKRKHIYSYLLSNSKTSTIESLNNVLIYGIGEYAESWTKWCEDNNKNILAYIVSSEVKKKVFLNKPIVLVKDITNVDNNLLVLASINEESGFSMLDTFSININNSYVLFSPGNKMFTKKKDLSIKIAKDSLEFIYERKISKIKNFYTKLQSKFFNKK